MEGLQRAVYATGKGEDSWDVGRNLRTYVLHQNTLRNHNGHSVPLSRPLHRTTKQLRRLAGRFGRCRSSRAIIVLRGLTAAV